MNKLVLERNYTAALQAFLDHLEVYKKTTTPSKQGGVSQELPVNGLTLLFNTLLLMVELIFRAV
jgi:hypothetical protein